MWTPESLRLARICCYLCRDCSKLRVEPEDAELILKGIYRVCRRDIEGLMTFYWAWVPGAYRPVDGKEGERQRALRLWMVLRSIVSCGRAKCMRSTLNRTAAPVEQCLGCDDRFYVLKAGGDARPVIRRCVQREIERLVVSALLDPLVVPVLSKAMEVDIDEQILPGCTLYTLALEIRRSTGGAEFRLSSDLADLLVRVLGGGQVNLSLLGVGPWILNGLITRVRDCWTKMPTAVPRLDDWPVFPDDWRELGECLSGTCSTKFRKTRAVRRKT